MKYLQNTIMVLAVTVITSFAIYAGVSTFASTATGEAFTATVLSSSTLAADTSDGTTIYTCPRTGCTETYCHATQGTDADTDTGVSDESVQGYGSGGYGRSGKHTMDSQNDADSSASDAQSL